VGEHTYCELETGDWKLAEYGIGTAGYDPKLPLDRMTSL
jgi:hypothetical protein